MKVIELSIVAKMLRPAAHHGIRWPPRKKSFVLLFFFEQTKPILTIPSRYSSTMP